MEDWIQQETPQLLQRRSDPKRRDTSTLDQHGMPANKRETTSLSSLPNSIPDSVAANDKDAKNIETTETSDTHSRLQE